MLVDDVFATTLLDLESVPQANLDITNRVRTSLLPWAGQFSPQLVEELLGAYGGQAGNVLDSFAGSGTALVEAARLGKSAIGSDVNPAAAVLARVYEFVNVSQSDREAVVASLESRLSQVIPALEVQHPKDGHNQQKIESDLLGLWHCSRSYHERILLEALIVLSDFYSPGLGSIRIFRNWNRLTEIVWSLPTTTQPVSVYRADARALPVETNSVDLVLTSPPYINVHNYHQKFRRSVEALGWNVLTAASSEIGSNRQNRGNRFLTVIQYSLDMTLALREMARVTIPEGRLILVLGRESQVRKVPFFNGRLVAELAVNSVGLEIERRQERQFVNRFGNRIREDILHFRVGRDFPDQYHCLCQARRIAGQTLSKTRRMSDVGVRDGIDNALEHLESVSPSPISDTRNFGQVPV